MLVTIKDFFVIFARLHSIALLEWAKYGHGYLRKLVKSTGVGSVAPCHLQLLTLKKNTEELASNKLEEEPKFKEDKTQ